MHVASPQHGCRYKEHAWGRDELKPISKGYETWFNLGLTLVDSLDTMLLMGLQSEYTEVSEYGAVAVMASPCLSLLG